MATKSPKRGTNKRRSTRVKKPPRSRAAAKRSVPARTIQAKQPSEQVAREPRRGGPKTASPNATHLLNSDPTSKSPRKRLPAWNEIEIDEQRESAGRPEPAFLSDEAYADDDLAEEMGEEFVMTATSGEQAAEDFRNQDVPEELGGPFVETSGRTEFAYGSDPSNPKDAEPAAFPTAINSLEEETALAQAEAEDQEERTS